MKRPCLGIVGGGQLGMMTAGAAQKMGFASSVFATGVNAPAEQKSHVTYGDYEDEDALQSWALQCDAITFEFEHIPPSALDFLSQLNISLRPHGDIIKLAQNRIEEKTFLREQKIPTAKWTKIVDESDKCGIQNELSFPFIVKTVRWGYDGLGQRLVLDAKEWHKIRDDFTMPSIAEELVPFVAECSMIGARGAQGGMIFYPLACNEHKDGILIRTIAPMKIGHEVTKRAEAIVTQLMQALDVVGLLAVEFFLLEDGSLLVNELAPRPHNSGHWTLDGVKHNQFEQLVRIAMGEEPIEPQPLEHVSSVEMVNILRLEDDYPLPVTKGLKNKSVYDYGKKPSPSRLKRKMGHINYVFE